MMGGLESLFRPFFERGFDMTLQTKWNLYKINTKNKVISRRTVLRFLSRMRGSISVMGILPHFVYEPEGCSRVVEPRLVRRVNSTLVSLHKRGLIARSGDGDKTIFTYSYIAPKE